MPLQVTKQVRTDTKFTLNNSQGLNCYVCTRGELRVWCFFLDVIRTELQVQAQHDMHDNHLTPGSSPNANNNIVFTALKLWEEIRCVREVLVSVGHIHV